MCMNGAVIGIGTIITWCRLSAIREVPTAASAALLAEVPGVTTSKSLVALPAPAFRHSSSMQTTDSG
jgi:hypothetical protein